MKSKITSKMKTLKIILKIALLIFILLATGIFVSNWFVEEASSQKLYDTTESIPYNKVGLLLGTGKKISDGSINPYYKFRIEAAVELFKSGKIEVILVSGDNSRDDYDEPSTMKDDLIENGVPEDRIYLDYAGFRTLDSVVRSKEIFGQSSITIISQPFHNERAVFIAKRKNIAAVGFNAKDVGVRFGLRTQLREKLARVKVLIDLVFGKEPKFLGDRVEISYS